MHHQLGQRAAVGTPAVPLPQGQPARRRAVSVLGGGERGTAAARLGSCSGKEDIQPPAPGQPARDGKVERTSRVGAHSDILIYTCTRKSANVAWGSPPRFPPHKRPSRRSLLAAASGRQQPTAGGLAPAEPEGQPFRVTRPAEGPRSAFPGPAAAPRRGPASPGAASWSGPQCGTRRPGEDRPVRASESSRTARRAGRGRAREARGDTEGGGALAGARWRSRGLVTWAGHRGPFSAVLSARPAASFRLPLPAPCCGLVLRIAAAHCAPVRPSCSESPSESARTAPPGPYPGLSAARRCPSPGPLHGQVPGGPGGEDWSGTRSSKPQQSATTASTNRISAAPTGPIREAANRDKLPGSDKQRQAARRR